MRRLMVMRCGVVEKVRTGENTDEGARKVTRSWMTKVTMKWMTKLKLEG